jgi:hypothetical protein
LRELKALASPPAIVSEVFAVVMVLLGKSGKTWRDVSVELKNPAEFLH